MIALMTTMTIISSGSKNALPPPSVKAIKKEITAAATTLIERGCRNVIVTLGSRGVLWVSGEGSTLVPQEHVVKAVDTTGAGDAFIGCFAHVLTHGGSVEEALRRANGYAANSVTKRGTQSSYPTADELEAWLA